jgi:HD-like signal output (HDOD) protein
LHIIVLDEDPERREAARVMVDRIGHRCTALDTVQGVVSRRGRLVPDLLLFSEGCWSDGGSQYLLKEGDGAGFRVLILGSSGALSRLPELLDEGAQGVLPVPLSPAQLDAAVEVVMAGPPACAEMERVGPRPSLSDCDKVDKRAAMREQVQVLAKDLREGRARLSAISPVAMELQTLCSGDDPPSLRQLVTKIEQDPNLATSVLKASNCVAYQGMPAVLDMAAAGRRLGLRRLGEVAQMEAIRGVFSAHRATGWSKLLSKMWRNTVTTAHACRLMADRLGGSSRGQVYSMALFHNLGEILIIDLYRSMGELPPKDGFAQGGLREDMDRNHQELGALLVKSWDMPATLAAICLAHHDPSQLPAGTPLARHAWLIGGCYRAVVEAGFTYKLGHGAEPPLEAASSVLGVGMTGFREVAEESVRWWQSGRA